MERAVCLKLDDKALLTPESSGVEAIKNVNHEEREGDEQKY